jgi:hypothetical protein
MRCPYEHIFNRQGGCLPWGRREDLTALGSRRTFAIALDLTAEQAAHLRRACGTARYAYNWDLAEWKRMHAAGEKPSMMKVKAAFNAPPQGRTAVVVRGHQMPQIKNYKSVMNFRAGRATTFPPR